MKGETGADKNLNQNLTKHTRARRSLATSDEAVKKRASRRLSQAGAHSAEAMWVLPVPTSPISTRSSRRPGNDSDSSPSRPSPSGHATADQS